MRRPLRPGHGPGASGRRGGSRPPGARVGAPSRPALPPYAVCAAVRAPLASASALRPALAGAGVGPPSLGASLGLARRLRLRAARSACRARCRARRSGALPPAARRGSLRAAALRLPRCLGPCPLPGLALRAAAGRPAWVVGPCASPGAAFAPGGPGASLAGRSSLRPGPLRRPAAALRALPSLLPRGRCAGLRPALFRAAPARLWGWGVPPAAAGGVPGSPSLLNTSNGPVPASPHSPPIQQNGYIFC